MKPGYCHIPAQTERYLDEQSALELQKELEDAEIQKMIESEDIDEYTEDAGLSPDKDELFQQCLVSGYDKEKWQKFEDKLYEYLRPIAARNLSED